MLVLTVKNGQEIVCDVPPSSKPTRVRLHLFRTGASRIKAGVDCPDEVTVWRPGAKVVPKGVSGG